MIFIVGNLFVRVVYSYSTFDFSFSFNTLYYIIAYMSVLNLVVLCPRPVYIYCIHYTCNISFGLDQKVFYVIQFIIYCKRTTSCIRMRRQVISFFFNRHLTSNKNAFSEFPINVFLLCDNTR